MSSQYLPSAREEELENKIEEVYNSGDCKKAAEMSADFLKEFPRSYIARHTYAVMHGDYSYDINLSVEESKKYREIANNGFKDLVEDPDLKKWPLPFQYRVRNEYYWFFELHKEQYELGIERISVSEGGHYSACVGSSMLAFKLLKEKNIRQAEDWAQRSVMHFQKYEAFAPNWYNINYFAAQSLACLGKYEEALLCYKDMYRKQKSVVNETEVTAFMVKIEEIKNYRK